MNTEDGAQVPLTSASIALMKDALFAGDEPIDEWLDRRNLPEDLRAIEAEAAKPYLDVVDAARKQRKARRNWVETGKGAHHIGPADDRLDDALAAFDAIEQGVTG